MDRKTDALNKTKAAIEQMAREIVEELDDIAIAPDDNDAGKDEVRPAEQ